MTKGMYYCSLCRSRYHEESWRRTTNGSFDDQPHATRGSSSNAPIVACCSVMPTATRHSHILQQKAATLKQTMGKTTAGRPALNSRMKEIAD
jgi:hypothetical protein